MRTAVSPAPYASVLYSQLADVEHEIKTSYRGQGTPDLIASRRHLHNRIAGLETTPGDGSAWTPLDALRWGNAAAGRRVPVEQDWWNWLQLVCARAGMDVPRGFERAVR